MLRYVQRRAERREFPCPEGMPEALHRLLRQRGIASAEQAEAFLHPCAEQLNDPLRLSDMARARARIRRAMDADEAICVFGDYDVDGVCAAAILQDYLCEAGARAQVYLPSRHSEGYGLNEAAVREIAQRCTLLVTVDCGVTSVELIALAKRLGLDCVVTDHHRPGELLPDCPVVNPLLADYPFAWLCGAGVALKLVEALGGREAAMARIDLAAIATVADVVSLTGENRAIVHLGLARINASPRPGVAALLEAAHVEKGALTSEGIAFRLAPRLNAGGRLGSARRSFDLLTQTDGFLAIAQADELEMENARRQSVEREIRAAAEAQLEDFDFSAHRVLLLRGEGWNTGVIGLAASHLREKYHYPVIVLSEADGMLTGSCRSIEGVDIYATLASAAALLEKFGGHSQAAGLTLKAENFEALWTALDKYLFENVSPERYLPFAEYDVEASLDEMSERFVRMLAALEPTGCGNPEPVFRCDARLIEARAIGAQGAHLKLICSQNGARRGGIFFGAGALAARLGESAELLFTPQLNLWNGRTDVQLKLSALREPEPLRKIEAARADEGAMQRKFLTQLFYNRDDTLPAPAISMAELKALLTARAQGVYVLCPDLDAARELLMQTPPGALDLFIGELPEEKRAFNALIVCPDRWADLPRALRLLVVAGGGPLPPLPEGVEARRLAGSSALWRELPDVDQLRQVYKAARRLTQRPGYLPDWEALDHRLSEESELSPSCCHVSLMALEQLGLLELRGKPFGLRLAPMRKADPMDSDVFRAAQEIKTNAERGKFA